MGFLLFGSPGFLWAYIDPGTGMAFISGIGVWIAAAFAFGFGLITVTYKKWVHGIRKAFSYLKNKITSSKS